MIDIQEILKNTEKRIAESSLEQLMADLHDCGLDDISYEGVNIEQAMEDAVDSVVFHVEVQASVASYIGSEYQETASISLGANFAMQNISDHIYPQAA